MLNSHMELDVPLLQSIAIERSSSIEVLQSNDGDLYETMDEWEISNYIYIHVYNIK